MANTLSEQLKAAQENYLKLVNVAPAKEVAAASDQIKALRVAIQKELTEGAEKCKQCGKQPHAIVHDEDARKPFEIGCIVCPDRRARANSIKDAVAKWNKGEFLPPRPKEPSPDDAVEPLASV